MYSQVGVGEMVTVEVQREAIVLVDQVVGEDVGEVVGIVVLQLVLLVGEVVGELVWELIGELVGELVGELLVLIVGDDVAEEDCGGALQG